MEGVCKELDEVRAELEKLREDYRVKTELSESLRRAHTDQVAKSQEAKLQIEKQAKELNVKSEEIGELRQLCEEVKSKLHETESSLRQVTSMNDKIRIDSGEKVQRLEVENRKLVSELEEVTECKDDLERKLHACSEEIGGLKRLLSESQRKCLEAEEKVRVGKELRHREEVILKLEEQSMSVQDQLKWKKEQFQHLEEAHKQLQDQFQLSKKEWATEKSALLEEMTSLQSSLDSQIRIIKSLESRLKMCNQALAHEESRRKLLEVQLSESKQCFENVLAEYEEAKAKIESFSTKRDEDIASLRNLLGMKEILLKETEYRVTHLEQDNKELLDTVKELQEAQINKRKADPSAPKLRNKLKDLEQLHSKCSLALKEREAEWNSKMEKLIGDMKCYESDLKKQSEQMQQLKMQLENCHSAMEVSGEETSILFMVLKSELSDTYSKLFSSKAHVAAFSEDKREKTAVSDEHLEMGDCSPLKTPVSLQQARKEMESLTQKLESLKLLEEHSRILEEALEEHKNMLQESSECQLRLKEQAGQLEVALRHVSAALERSNSELTAKISEARQAEIELQLWKSKAESFRICLEQSQEVCQKMEMSLLEQVETEQGLRKENQAFQCRFEEQNRRINDLHQNIASLNQLLEQKEAATETIKVEVVEALRKEEHYLQIMKERDTTIESLRKELKTMEEQSGQRASSAADSARREAESSFEREKEKLCRIIEEKGATVEYLQKELEAMEEQSVKRASGAAESARLDAQRNFEREKDELCRIMEENGATVEYLRKELEAMEEQSVRRASLAATSARLDAESKSECEKEELCRIIKERDATIEDITKELEAMEESVRRALAAAESARLELASNHEQEKEELCRIITTEKDETIKCLSNLASSLERDFVNAALFSLSQGVENLVKISALQEALEKTEFHMNSEMERKNISIDILESEVNNLHEKVSLQEDSLLHSKQFVEELEALVEVKKSEMEKLENRFREEQTRLKGLVKDLELKTAAATDTINRLSSEKNSLLIFVEGVCEQFGDFCLQDAKLDGMLGKLLQNSDRDDTFASNVLSYIAQDPVQKDVKKEFEPRHDRSPLRVRNQ